MLAMAVLGMLLLAGAWLALRQLPDSSAVQQDTPGLYGRRSSTLSAVPFDQPAPAAPRGPLQVEPANPPQPASEPPKPEFAPRESPREAKPPKPLYAFA